MEATWLLVQHSFLTLQKLLCKLARSLCGSCSLSALWGLSVNAIALTPDLASTPRYHTKTAGAADFAFFRFSRSRQSCHLSYSLHPLCAVLIVVFCLSQPIYFYFIFSFPFFNIVCSKLIPRGVHERVNFPQRQSRITAHSPLNLSLASTRNGGL